MRVAVIGAGPTGLTVAHRLALRGDDVDVLEASPRVGGLARSLSLWGHTVDLGSHIFTTADPEVAALWARLAGEVRILELRRGIWTGDAVLPYPPRPLATARALGVRTTAAAAGGVVRSRLGRRRAGEGVAPRSAEDAIVASYGRPLYDRLFRQYAEKLWGLPGAAIDAAFVASLVGETEIRRRSDPRFAYPVGGTGSVWEAMTAEITDHGGRIHLATPVSGLLIDGDRVGGLRSGEVEYAADAVVSTMPAHLLLRALPAPPDDVSAAASTLRARSTILVYLLVSGGVPPGNHWVYVYPSELAAGRVTFFGAWAEDPAAATESVVSLELWCDPSDERWSAADDELIDLAGRELIATGLIGHPIIAAGHVERLRGTHPVFDLGFQDRVATVHRHLATWRNLHTAGRHGRHGMPGVGTCMEDAFELADSL